MASRSTWAGCKSFGTVAVGALEACGCMDAPSMRDDWRGNSLYLFGREGIERVWSVESVNTVSRQKSESRRLSREMALELYASFLLLFDCAQFYRFDGRGYAWMEVTDK